MHQILKSHVAANTTGCSKRCSSQNLLQEQLRYAPLFKQFFCVAQTVFSKSYQLTEKIQPLSILNFKGFAASPFPSAGTLLKITQGAFELSAF
jgi:hypothetical protein